MRNERSHQRSPLRIRLSRRLAGAAIAGLLSGQAAFAIDQGASVLARADLSRALTRAICSQGKTPTMREAWRLGVYDAQLEGQTIETKTGARVAVTDLERASRIIAQRNNHHGATSGLCAHGLGWVVTSPSATPLVKAGSEGLLLDRAELLRHCRATRIDYADASGGEPRRIRVSPSLRSEPTIRLNLSLLGPGVVTVTCTPREPSWQGPVLWYMAPVAGGPGAAAPAASVLEDASRSEAERLIAWVNAVRAKEGLKPVFDGHPQLNSLSRQLIETGSIQHNRNQIRAAGAELKKLAGLLVGENRVKSASLADMAWLLWNSPRHRDLILTRGATHVAVATTKVKNEDLAVLVFAKF